MQRAHDRARKRAARRAAVLARRTVLAAGAAIGAGGLVVPAADAATFEVTSLADGGPGTLRRAIADAEADPAHDTITFATGLSGQIDLLTPISISTPMTIEGPGADVITIGGNDSVNLFIIATATRGEPVTISGLTLTDGRSDNGGAILSFDADLTITDSVITGNTAVSGSGGGVFVANGGLTISGTRIADNSAGRYGGGVYYNGIWNDPGTLHITDSVISGNTSGREGGGLALYDVYADAEVRRSTISGNTAARDGGGVWFEDTYDGVTVGVFDSTVSGNTSGDEGGGVSFGENFSGLTCIVDSTIVGNTAVAGGGVQLADAVAPDGRFEILGSTITGNHATSEGGGIFRGYATWMSNAPTVVTSSVISGNTAGTAEPDIGQGEVTGTLTLGNSLVGDASGAVFVETANGNLFGVDPQLGPLADNGGPTRTRLPAATSPLIDAGQAGGQTTDQRGLARTVDDPSVPAKLNSDGTDIGAVELQVAAPSPAAVAVAPTITAITPSSGQAGTSVVIRGGDFATTRQVLFGDTPATFVVDGHDQITAVAPAGLEGTAAIVVVTAPGSSAPTPAAQFSYVPAPVSTQQSQAQETQRSLICARVPTLVGYTLAAARRVLDRDGCQDVRLQVEGGRKGRGPRIVVQKPQAGTPLYQGDRVVVRLETRKRKTSRSGGS